MKRYRFLAADWPLAITTIGARLKAAPFTNERGDGFLLDRIRPDFLEGRHFERVVSTEVIENPFGEMSTYERVLYREVRFRLSKDYPQIELRNPPRSVRVFFNRLAEILEFGMAVEQLLVEPTEWADQARSLGSAQGFVQTIEISQLAVDEWTTAKIVLNGKKDVLKTVKNLVAKRPYRVDRVNLVLDTEIGKLAVLFSADGSVQLPDDSSPELLDHVRRALPESKASRG